jgi:hypothetical protein
VIYELGLFLVMVAAGYWGWYFTRHRPHGTATFGVMQLAAAALAGLGFLGHWRDIGWLGIPGAIGLAARVPPARPAGPRAGALAGRLRADDASTRLPDLAEIPAPGSASPRRRRRSARWPRSARAGSSRRSRG